jgi:hypothetical protein
MKRVTGGRLVNAKQSAARTAKRLEVLPCFFIIYRFLSITASKQIKHLCQITLPHPIVLVVDNDHHLVVGDKQEKAVEERAEAEARALEDDLDDDANMAPPVSILSYHLIIIAPSFGSNWMYGMV